MEATPSPAADRVGRSPAQALPTWRVCAAGAMALAAAMGIGRFAFTPQLPLMLRDGLLDADGGAWLASVNYLGYLIGALSAARLAAQPRRLVLACLFGTALVTAAAGLGQGLAGWLLLRGAAGVLSAWVLVGVSAWSLGELVQRERADAAGVVFSGVGLGIAAVGVLAWVWGGAGSAGLWLALGGLALVLALAVQQLWPRARPMPLARLTPGGLSTAAAQTPTPADSAPMPAVRPPMLTPMPTGPARLPPGSARLVFCYGSFGFGYILPATYLPAIARALVDDPRLFGLAWPVFGLAAAASTLLASRALRRGRLLDVWSGCHLLMAVGSVLPLLSRSGTAIALAALLVGGTFMVATMTGLQQARKLSPADPARLIGRMTAAFAIGQIAGPLVAMLLARLPLAGASGIEATLALAAMLLFATAFWLRFPFPATETPNETPTGSTGR